jgi:hypothetical protein
MEIIDAGDFDDLSAQWLVVRGRLDPGAALSATTAAG